MVFNLVVEHRDEHHGVSDEPTSLTHNSCDVDRQVVEDDHEVGKTHLDTCQPRISGIFQSRVTA